MTSRERTRQNYDRMSRWYDLFAGSEKKFTLAGLQLLGVKDGEYILEIGFGTGHSLAMLAKQAGKSGLVTGIELSPGMIGIASKRVRADGQERKVKMIQGDGTLLPFVNNSFDAVFLSFTLELFNDEEISVVLNELLRVLKSEGRLGVVSLVKRNVLACHLYEWGHERWPILLDCRPIELRNILKAAGFRVQAAKVQTMWGLPVEIALSKPL